MRCVGRVQRRMRSCPYREAGGVDEFKRPSRVELHAKDGFVQLKRLLCSIPTASLPACHAAGLGLILQ